MYERKVLFCFAVRQQQQPADQNREEQEHTEYSHIFSPQMSRTDGFTSLSFMIPWSGYCTADLRGTVKCDRMISPRIDLKGARMKCNDCDGSSPPLVTDRDLSVNCSAGATCA